MSQLEYSHTFFSTPSADDRSAHDRAIAPFLQLGEIYYGNYGLIQQPNSPLPTLEMKIRQLYQSGKYLSVRTSEEACFDLNGRHYTGSVAIVVTPMPKGDEINPTG